MRVCPLVAVFALLVGWPTPLGAQDERSPLERRVEEIDVLAERFNRASALELGEVGLALWRLRDEPDELTRAAWDDTTPRWGGRARDVLDALLDRPPLPRVEGPLALEALVTLLEPPSGEDALRRIVRTTTFTRGLDRQPSLDLALTALEARRPGHPWVAEARALRERTREVLAGIEAVFAALALPIDPRTTPRVTLPERRRGPDEVPREHPLTRLARRGSGAWVLRTGEGPRFFDDRLRLGPAPATDLEPRDVEDEVRDWALGSGHGSFHLDPLGVRGAGSTALRAWWASRLGLPWTATRLAGQCASDRDPIAPAEVLSDVAIDLAGAVQVACFHALGAGAPRGPLALALRRSAAALEVPLAFGALDEEDGADRPRLESEVLELASRLEEQDAALRVAPPIPVWAEWQLLTPAERVPFLVRALPNLDGDPSDILGFGGGSAWRATQRVPADAPPPDERRRRDVGGFSFERGDDHPFDRTPSGRSAADELVRCGEAAIPALIEALSDPGLTRCMSSDGDLVIGVMSVAEIAHDVLTRIISNQDVSFLRPLPAGEEWSYPAQLRARQAAAREWWATWAPRGGLFALHLEGLLEAEREIARGGEGARGGRYSRGHRVAWLHEHGGGREVETMRALLLSATAPSQRTEWIDLVSDAPHDGYVDLLRTELDAGSPRCAMAAAAALLDRGDRRGLPRARALLEAAFASPEPVADEDLEAVQRALWLLLHADMQAYDILLRAAEARRSFDDDLARPYGPPLPAVVAPLVLARIAARPWELPPVPTSGPLPPARVALDRLRHEQLEPLREEDRGRLIAAALADALRARRDPIMVRHAAVTAALARCLDLLVSAADVDPIPVLVAALADDDPVPRQAAIDALDRLPRAWAERLEAAAPEEACALLASARRRAERRVVAVETSREVPLDLHEALVSWRGELLDVERVRAALAAWSLTDATALRLTLERVGTERGLRVSASCSAADASAIELAVEVDGADAGEVEGALERALEADGWSRLVVRARR